MTLYVTRHPDALAVVGRPGAMPEIALDGQRLPLATDSQSFTGPAEMRLASDVDCFVAVSGATGTADTSAPTALWMPAGSVQWVHVPAGDWKVRWSA